MNASMVRLGGILAFVTLAVVVIMMVLGRTIATTPVLGIIIGLILYALIIFVFWATKGLFNAKGYRRADIAILGIIVLIVLNWLLSLVGGSGMAAMSNPQALSAGLNVMVIIGLILFLAWFTLWILFGIQSMGFSSQGGGLWKAIGILYLIGCGLFLLAIVLVILGLIAKSGGLAAFGGILVFIGMLVLVAAWICHGIGLITGAGRMATA
jgi:hypothetical protein